MVELTGATRPPRLAVSSRMAALAVLVLVALPVVVRAAPPKNPKVSARLLEQRDQVLERAEGPPGAAKPEAVELQVYIHAPPVTPDLLDRITAAGGRVELATARIVQASIPASALDVVAAFPDVLYVEPPRRPQRQVGSVTSQGDAVVRAAAVRAQLGADGTGIRVGVISGGLAGLAQSIARGDLPPTTFFCRSASGTVPRPSGCLRGETLVGTTGGVTARSFIHARPSLGDDAEGTAMLEIIHDLAPGAELWFANDSTDLEAVAAWSFLAANVDVIVCDELFLEFFPNGQHALAEGLAALLANPANRARAYVQAAGNYATQHYTGRFTDSGSASPAGNWHRFAAGGSTTGPATPALANRLTLAALDGVVVVLSWDDPPTASSNDYDLYLLDCASGARLAASTEPQTGVQPPLEGLVFVNFSITPRDVCYGIVNVQNSAAPRTLNVITAGTNAVAEFNTRASSLGAPADTPGDFIVVGAVPSSSPATPEPFSSHGPTLDGRPKPDVMAPDGVSVTGAGGFDTQFFGTSAAAPHVAGVAALLLQLRPGLTRPELKALLQQSAVPMGLDANAVGAGRVDALGAAQRAGDVRVLVSSAQGRIGDEVILGFDVRNPTAGPVEVYLGVLTPDARTVVLFTSSGTPVPAPVSAPGRFSALEVAAPSVSHHRPAFVSLPIAVGTPAGTYRMFAALVRAGSLADDRIDPGDIVAIDTTTFTVSASSSTPAAPP